MTSNGCPAESFIAEGEAAYEASRYGLADILQRVAEQGLDVLSSKQTHEVDKRRKIYEFIKGDLRLFYFKGQGNVIVVCVAGVVKKGQKVDKKAVTQAAKWKDAYEAAMRNGNLEWDISED